MSKKKSEENRLGPLVVDYLAGTCRSANDAAEHFETDIDLVNSIMEHSGYVECCVCGWWVELCETERDFDDDFSEPTCMDCS